MITTVRSGPPDVLLWDLMAQNHHHELEYMKAQEVQNTFVLDADWLAVGLVDEFVQFAPANTTRGWAIVIADP